MIPLYEFADADGDRIDLHLPVEERNNSVEINGRIYRRSRDIPDRVAIILPGPTPDQSFNAQVRKGYYDREQKLGSRFEYTGREGLTKKQLADLWSDTGS